MEVPAHAFFRDRPVQGRQQIGGGDLHVVDDLAAGWVPSSPAGRRPRARWRPGRDGRPRCRRGRRRTSRVLVGAHLGECRLVRRRIVLDGNLRGHAAHGVGPVAVADVDDVRDSRPGGTARSMVISVRSGKTCSRAVIAEFFHHAEHVIPAPGSSGRRCGPAAHRGSPPPRRRPVIVSMSIGGSGSCRGAGRARPGRGRRPRSRAGPRGGSPASADRNTGRSRGRGAPGHCGRKYRPQSNSEAEMRAPRCRARVSPPCASRAGRARMVAILSLSAYRISPRALV